MYIHKALPVSPVSIKPGLHNYTWHFPDFSVHGLPRGLPELGFQCAQVVERLELVDLSDGVVPVLISIRVLIACV